MQTNRSLDDELYNDHEIASDIRRVQQVQEDDISRLFQCSSSNSGVENNQRPKDKHLTSNGQPADQLFFRDLRKEKDIIPGKQLGVSGAFDPDNQIFGALPSRKRKNEKISSGKTVCQLCANSKTIKHKGKIWEVQLIPLDKIADWKDLYDKGTSLGIYSYLTFYRYLFFLFNGL